MTFDLILWMPDLQRRTALMVLLVYGVFSSAHLYTEQTVHKKNMVSSGHAGSFQLGTPNILPILENDLKQSSLLDQAPQKNMVVLTGPTHASMGMEGETQQRGGPTIQNHRSTLCILWCVRGALQLALQPFEGVHGSGLFQRDGFNTTCSVILRVFGALCVHLSRGWQTLAKVRHVEYISLICLALYGGKLRMMSTDLRSMVFSLELQSFCFIVLCGYNTGSLYSIEAALKYFRLSAFSSCLLLRGISLLYWSTGLTNCSHLAELRTLGDTVTDPLFKNDLLIWIGVWFVSISLMWKLAAAPLHQWAADVYVGVWSPVTLMISTFPKLAVRGFWISQWHPIWASTWNDAMIVFSALSLLVGALGALAQRHLKKLRAYSSIAHMGFRLIALCSPLQGTGPLFVHLLLYMLSSLAIWGILRTPLRLRGVQTGGTVSSNSTHSQHFQQNLETRRLRTESATPIYIWDLSYRWKTAPYLSFVLLLSMMSLAGLPPVAGFLGKLGLFWWGVTAKLYGLRARARRSTLISTVYYLRLLRVSYLHTPGQWTHTMKLPSSSAFILSLASLGLRIGLWYSSPLVLLTHMRSLGLNSNYTLYLEIPTFYPLF